MQPRADEIELRGEIQSIFNIEEPEELGPRCRICIYEEPDPEERAL